MTEAWTGCNARSGAKRARDDLDPAEAIDKRHVEAHVAVLPGGKRCRVFACRRPDTRDLAGQQALRRRREVARAFDLDEHRRLRVGADQVDLARPPAPAAGEDAQSTTLEECGDPVLRRQAAELGGAPRQSSAASFRAR